MIPKECKRLAEVDFPIAVVSRHSAREKSIRHGHPSTLHLWWARRPLAACRAMLMALLLPDPCDPNCPGDFKVRARNILPRVQGVAGETDIDLRKELLRFIGDFANWDNAASPTYLEAARGLVRAAHGEELPLVVDPFAGGGSIPFEALRLGCDAFATDLNPVASLILRTTLVDIPRLNVEVDEALRTAGKEVAAIAERELGRFYTPDPDRSQPIAYLWARTITCDSCGGEIPLVSSFWLCKKNGKRKALKYHTNQKGKRRNLRLELFEPRNDDEVPNGTVKNAKVQCPFCPAVMGPDRLRAQIEAVQGGCDVEFDPDGNRVGGALLLAVAIQFSDSSARGYRLPTARDYQLVHAAQKHLTQLVNQSAKKDETSPVPDELINSIRPSPNARGLSAPTRYGISKFRQLFTSRELLDLIVLGRAVQEWSSAKDNDALLGLLACAVAKRADYGSAGTRWHLTFEKTTCTFSKQALAMTWDFVEPAPLGNASGSFGAAIDTVEAASRTIAIALAGPGQVQVADAVDSPLPSQTANIWFTDPPYYDAIPYADLSDYFLVWLKRILPTDTLLRDPFDQANPLSPKVQECVWNQSYVVNGGPKDGRFFEQCVSRAFIEGRRVLASDGIACVVFAHKTTEGWEALLNGLVAGGWVILSSWPIATERLGRLQSQQSAALATSVHLVCRPRPEDALIGDWSDVLRELPQRVGDWIERLQSEGIKGADLVFACIGPAMEIYSRYRRVEDAEGREIPLGGDPTATEPYQRGFLAYVWETVGRLALEEVLGTAEARARNGAAGALEEDSRLTALFLWTLQSTESDSQAANGSETNDGEDTEDIEEESAKPKKKKGGYTLIYDVARRFAQPLGIHLEKWEGRMIETDKGIVRLLPVTERATQLFGEADAAAISSRFEEDAKANRNLSFDFMYEADAAPEIKARGRKAAGKGGSKAQSVVVAEMAKPQQATTLDRLHAAMLLQRSGQTNGLRALLKEEVQRGPDFVRLANALVRLYPTGSDEKRLLEAMLLAVPRS